MRKSIGFDDENTSEIIHSVHKNCATYNSFVSHARMGGHSRTHRVSRLLKHVQDRYVVALLVFVGRGPMSLGVVVDGRSFGEI